VEADHGLGRDDNVFIAGVCRTCGACTAACKSTDCSALTAASEAADQCSQASSAANNSSCALALALFSLLVRICADAVAGDVGDLNDEITRSLELAAALGCDNGA
jgi:hypothetical protein